MRKAWTLEILLFLLYFSFGISWLAYSPMLPEIEGHFRVSHAEAGALISSVSLAKAFVPLLAGLLARRIGLYGALLVGAFLAALSPLIPYSPTFEAMLASRFLFGIGGAMLVTLTGAVVMQLFPREQLPLVNGLNNVAVNAGITTALFVAIPVSNLLGWQRGLAGLGLLSGLLMLMWAVLGRSSQYVSASDKQAGVSLGEVVRMKETWLIALAFTGPLSLYLGLNTWLPSHYVEAFQLSRDAAAKLTGLFNLVGIPTAIAGGLLTSKLGLRRPLIIAAGLLMPPAALGLVLTPDASLRVVSAVLLGISLFLYVSPLFTIPMELPGASAAKVAVMNGVIFSSAYLVSFASPILVGKVAARTGSYSSGLVLFAVGSVVLAVAGFLLPETGTSKRTAS